VAGSCEYGDEHSGSGATELVGKRLQNAGYLNARRDKKAGSPN
jgi:hypothetical protein